jgi:hypothetical protein
MQPHNEIPSWQARRSSACHVAQRVQRTDALDGATARLCEAVAATCRRAQEVIARSVHGRTERYAVPVGRGVVKRCAWCDRIRTASGTWRVLASSAPLETDVIVSHGICADCRHRVYPAQLDDPAESHGQPECALLVEQMSAPPVAADRGRRWGRQEGRAERSRSDRRQSAL